MTINRLFGEDPIENVVMISVSKNRFGYKLKGDKQYRIIDTDTVFNVTE